MKSYDVIIVGGGITGASALHYLSQQNLSILLLEKNNQLGQGASGLWGFLTRVLHSNLEITKLAHECFDFHLNFPKYFGGDNHYLQTGSLYFLKEKNLNEFRLHLDFMKDSSIPFEILNAKEGKERFPRFFWYEDDVAIYEPLAGLTGLGKSVSHLVHASCRKENIDYHLNADVEKIIHKNDLIAGVKLSTGEEISAKVVVLCVGSWLTRLTTSLNESVPWSPRVIQLCCFGNRFNRYHRGLTGPFFIDLHHSTFGHHSPNGSFVGGYLGPQQYRDNTVLGKLNNIEANEAKYEIGKRISWIKSAALEGGECAVESYSEQGIGQIIWSSQIKNLMYTGGFSCTGYSLFPKNGRDIAQKVAEAL